MTSRFAYNFAPAAAALLSLVVASIASAQGGRPPGGAGGSPRSEAVFEEEAPRKVYGPSLSVTDELVTEIRVEGNRTVPASRVLAQLETRVGRNFDPQALSRDVKKLASLPWFVDVQPLSKTTAKGRVIILRVSERATIRYIEYLGNAKLKDKKLAKETGLKVGSAVDPYAVEDGRRRLEDLYHENGYPRAQIEVIEGDRLDDKGVVYAINEGVQQKIWSVKFEGNNSDFASDRRLYTKVKSKPGKLYLFGGKLKRQQLDADVRSLEVYYRTFGFFQAKVGRVLEFNDEGTWATIRFVIHEGPRYQVRNVRFMGNERFSTDDLASGLKLTADAAYEQAKQKADVEWLKEVYGSQGYVFADVRPEVVYLEQPGQVDLVYNIDEGKKWRVGRIFVQIGGENPHTRIQTALNRLSVRPGEILDVRELRASERRLQASSLFLSEPARGITPKITYRIPELGETEFTASGGRPSFRGQDPASQDAGRPSLWNRLQSAGQRVHEAFRPAHLGWFGDGDRLDVELRVGTEAANKTYEVTLAQPESIADNPRGKRHTVRKPPTTYSQTHSVYTQNVAWRQPFVPAATTAARPVFRGQSPTTPTAYPSTYPTTPTTNTQPVAQQAVYQAAPAASGYGGVAPKAVSPDAAPAGYNAPVDGQPGAVQQTQFGQPFPTAPTPSAGAPSPRVMGAPYVSPNVDPTILPDARLFPNGGFAEPGQLVDLYVQLQEAQTGRFMIGAGINSDAGVVGQILIDESNFDWRKFPRSFGDFYDGTAFRGGGQRFRIEAAPGTEVQRYLLNWQDPYFRDLPISLSLSGSYFDRRFEDYDEQRLGGRIATGYQWTANDLSGQLTYRGASVKISDPIVVSSPGNDGADGIAGTADDVPAVVGASELDEVAGQSNVLHGFGIRIINDTRNNPFLATDGHFVSLELEQVIGDFDYPRAILDARKYFLIRERPDHSGRHVLSTSTRLGFTGSNTPIYEHFFAGGFSTLRGFDFRGAGPVTTSSTGVNVEVGGEFMWVNTIEYMFPLTADDMVSAVAFCDFGTVERNVTIKDFRVAPGVGLRLTIPAMGPAPIALDFAWPIAHAESDDRQVFTFNVGFQR